MLKRAPEDPRKRMKESARDAYNEDVLKPLVPDERTKRCLAALAMLFPTLKPAELEDYAAIAAFLMGSDAHEMLGGLDAVIGPAILQIAAAKGYAGASAETALTSVAVSPSKVLRLIMHRDAGFSNAPGVYFVGDAGNAFARVVGAGMLFTDGLSFVHGEFSHTIQWLLVFRATQTTPPRLRLSRSVAQLYRESIRVMSTFPLSAERGGGEVEKPIALWDFCVDCFVPRAGGVRKVCNVLTSLFSETARSPAWVQRQLTYGDYSGTLLGKLLNTRDERRPFGGGMTLADARASALGGALKPDALAGHYIERAHAGMRGPPGVPKPRVVFPDAPGALLRDPLWGHAPGTSKKQAVQAAMGAPSGLAAPFDEGQLNTMYDAIQRPRAAASSNPFEDEWLALYPRK